MRGIRGWMLVAVLAGSACGRKPAAPAAAGGGPGAMGGMRMTMQGMGMMPMMRAHLDSVAMMSPAQMAAMMATHQDLASRMMDAMGADMRGMNMKPDSAWAALGDSLRQDLAELPGLSGEALKGRMQAHLARMRRMMATHQGMMKM